MCDGHLSCTLRTLRTCRSWGRKERQSHVRTIRIPRDAACGEEKSDTLVVLNKTKQETQETQDPRMSPLPLVENLE
jgi:hypothetical protein